MDNQIAAMGNAYKYNGETHYVIDPITREDLRKAFAALHELRQLMMTTPDMLPYSELHKVQTRKIMNFITGLGKYDPVIFQKNIIYLAKEYGITLGELEDLLGVSPGYISRTAKDNSGKRLGLEIAWRAALIFDVDLTDLVNQDISARRGNTVLVLKFIDKLITMTRNVNIQWQNLGGFNSDYDERLVENNIISFENGDAYYHLPDYPDDTKVPLADDIVSLPHFINGKSDLMIIPYQESEGGETHYDFLSFTEKAKQRGKDDEERNWTYFFSFYDDYEGVSDKAAQKLYSAIRDMEYDAIIAPDNKSFIVDFLNQ